MLVKALPNIVLLCFTRSACPDLIVKRKGVRERKRRKGRGGGGDRDREGGIDATALYGIGQRLVLVCKMENT